MSKKIRVGLVGSGFSASFHMACYHRVAGVDFEIAGVTSGRKENAERFATEHDIPTVYESYTDLFEDEHIDVVDLCIPVYLHKKTILEASERGKHIICEKPLIGYAGEGVTGDIPKEKMFEQICSDLEEIEHTLRRNGTKLMYGENWIYAPAIRKALALIRASKGTILFIHGHERHSGSHSDYSKEWQYSGGGALLRLGIHPLTATIYLKNAEGRHRYGKPIRVREVLGQVANLTEVESFQREERKWLVTDWQDVEDWAVGILTFTDGSVAVVSGADISLGGIDSVLEVYLSNARIRCNMEPNNVCMAYTPNGSLFESEYLTEKQETKEGWSFPAVDEEWMMGYPQELQDFLECVAFDREPISGFDLAAQAITAAYAIYSSAESGCKKTLLI